MNTTKSVKIAIVVFTIVICWLGLKYATHVPKNKVETSRQMVLPKELQKQQKIIGASRIEKVNDHIYVAMGYDLANTVLIHTKQGNIVIDVSSAPTRAKKVKTALLKKAPGTTKAIIYTHSHIDHVGGASAWVEKKTQIWATDAFVDHFLKQYSLFRPAEARRGWRQMGQHVPAQHLPCSALGKRLDVKEALQSGARMPTHTFSNKKILNIAGVEIHLIEAHGETHDQMLVWLPKWKILLPGDNYYHAFPNLYTIRGTQPRPVNEWIKSLDKMRYFQAEIMIPSHTQIIYGAQKIQQALTNYRDAIQWIRDEVVRRANRGEDLDFMVEKIGLPPHLLKVEALKEMYGQIDWSTKAIYTNELGWFDGRADRLYSLPATKILQKELKLMGGAKKVLQMAIAAHKKGEVRWAIHLLAKLRDSRMLDKAMIAKVKKELAVSFRSLAKTIFNTNGRAYLLETAYELEQGVQKIPQPKIDKQLLEKVPLSVVFHIMGSRLIPEKAITAWESVKFIFSDTKQTFYVTVRKGIAEIARGTPFPNTPKPIATITTDSMTWKLLARKQKSSALAIASGDLKISNKIAFARFMKRFDRK